MDKDALAIHKKFGGKIAIGLRDTPTLDTLKLYYTPGVGAVSSYVAAHPRELGSYSWTHNVVAVVSDGSAVLGLGNIGAEGAMPVMEGKAMLFKHFANIDAVPIVLTVQTPDEIVAAVKAIAPSFGGINLEDIAAPQCFEIEHRLQAELSIPVMHDDQHGTAIVVLAGLINAAKVTGRRLSDMRIVVAGAGAAGTAVMNILHRYAKPEIIAVDSKGIVGKDRKDLNDEKRKLLTFTNPRNLSGSQDDALQDADMFIGVSGVGTLAPVVVKTMASQPIIFAISNPNPEILPDAAKKAGAAVVATGRSDFPNQINNALVFPGVFRGALDNKVSAITDDHKILAAEALASLVGGVPTPDMIIPSVFDPRVMPAVAKAIR